MSLTAWGWGKREEHDLLCSALQRNPGGILASKAKRRILGIFTLLAFFFYLYFHLTTCVQMPRGVPAGGG